MDAPAPLTPQPDPEPPPIPLWRQSMATTEVGETGFSGLLLLVVLGRVVSPLMLGFGLYVSLTVLNRNGFWTAVTTPGLPPQVLAPAWLFLGVLIGQALLLVYDLVLLWLLFTRRRAFPPAMIVYLVLSSLFSWGAFGATAAVLGPGSADASRAVIGTIVGALWIAYFVRSQRVKHTFVR